MSDIPPTNPEQTVRAPRVFESPQLLGTRLSPTDFDEAGRFIVEGCCRGCEITNALVEIHSSGESKHFDVNHRESIARILLEGVYVKCPGRAKNSQPDEKWWRSLGKRVLGLDIQRDSSKESDTTYPCGLDRNGSVDEVAH